MAKKREARDASEGTVAAARAIRDHVLPAIRQRGTITAVGGSLRVLTLKENGWIFAHFTLFSPIGSAPAAATHQEAVLLQAASQALPYGLDIWCRRKVLSIRWDDTRVEIVSFERGPWEAELLTGIEFVEENGGGARVRLRS
jgi:hypothetical protein